MFYFGVVMCWWGLVEGLVWVKRRGERDGWVGGVVGVGRYNSIVIVSYWLIMLITLYLNELTDHFRFLSV